MYIVAALLNSSKAKTADWRRSSTILRTILADSIAWHKTARQRLNGTLQESETLVGKERIMAEAFSGQGGLFTILSGRVRDISNPVVRDGREARNDCKSVF